MVQVVILANSFKTGGRCVAGVSLESMRWVRPVSNRADRELTVAETRVMKGEAFVPVRPGDVVDMTIGESRPTPYHPEDVSYVPDWVYLGTLTPADIARRLDPIIKTQGPTLGWPGKGLDPTTIVTGAEHPSLELRRVDNVSFKMVTYETQKLRVDIDGLNLSVTDLAFNHTELDGIVLPSALLTISLAEPFPPKNGSVPICYKLVAAVLALG